MSAREYWSMELRKLAPKTRRHYRMYVDGFLEYADMKLEELYERHKGYIFDEDPRSNRIVPNLVVNYVDTLLEEGYSTGHCNNVAYAVKHFFRANSLLFPLSAGDLPAVRNVGSKVVSRDEIKRWMELFSRCHFEDRNKAICMVSKDLGFRCSDVAGLDVKHVLKARVVERGGEVFRVFQPYVTQKTGELAYPHWGPEAERYAMEYLGDRESGPLFLDLYGKRMRSNTLGMVFIGLKPRMESDSVTHHSLRKFHRTRLEAVMPESYVKKLQGKATDPYIHPEQTGELTEKYLECYDALRVYGESKELRELKEEHVDMRTEMQLMKRQLAEIRREQERDARIRDYLDRRK